MWGSLLGFKKSTPRRIAGSGIAFQTNAAPLLAKVEGPVARAPGPRAQAKGTEAREGPQRELGSTGNLPGGAGRMAEGQHRARGPDEDPEGKVDGSVEGREEERGPRRCPAPAALCR